MKMMRVGSWYNKLTEQEKAHFKAKVEFHDVNKLRTYYSTARKTFESDYAFGPSLTVTKGDKIYYFSYDRKDFTEIRTNDTNAFYKNVDNNKEGN